MDVIEEFTVPRPVNTALAQLISSRDVTFTGLSPNLAYDAAHLVYAKRDSRIHQWTFAPSEQHANSLRLSTGNERVYFGDEWTLVERNVIEAGEGDVLDLIEEANRSVDDRFGIAKLRSDMVRLYGPVAWNTALGAAPKGAGMIWLSDLIDYANDMMRKFPADFEKRQRDTIGSLADVSKAAKSEQKRLADYIELLSGNRAFAQPGVEVPPEIFDAIARTAGWAPLPFERTSSIFSVKEGRGDVFVNTPGHRGFALEFEHPQLARELAAEPETLLDDWSMGWFEHLDLLPEDELSQILNEVPDRVGRDRIADLVVNMVVKRDPETIKENFESIEDFHKAVSSAIETNPQDVADTLEQAGISARIGGEKVGRVVERLERFAAEDLKPTLPDVVPDFDSFADRRHTLPAGSNVLMKFTSEDGKSSRALFMVEEKLPTALDEGRFAQAFVAVNPDRHGHCDEIREFGTDLAAAYAFANPEIVDNTISYWTRNDLAASLREVGLPDTEKMIDKLIESTDGLSAAVSIGNEARSDQLRTEAKALRKAVDRLIAEKKGKEVPERTQKKSVGLS